MSKKYHTAGVKSKHCNDQVMVMFSLLVFIILLFLCIGVTYAATSRYTYDNLYRLTKVDYGNGTVIEYTNDAAGNRLNQTVSRNTPLVNSFTPAGFLVHLQW